MFKKIISRYLVYIVYFLGIGMTSSGIVLMPFNHMRYGLILIIGLSLFATGSYVNEVFIDKKSLSPRKTFKLVIVSLAIAIGIGMVSGGIAHFKESPDYVSYLIPLGVMISFVSFIFKNEYTMKIKEFITIVSMIGVVAAGLHVGLSIAANDMTMNSKIPPGGDIFTGHSMK